MANTFAPFGFVQYSGTGSVPTYEQVAMKIVGTSTTKCYFGDAVTPVSGSLAYIAPTANGATSAIAGVFVGCKYLSAAQKRTVWSNWFPGGDVATGTDVEAYVINDPNAQFKVQAAANLNVTAANTNKNVDVSTTQAGNQYTGISGQAISGVATTATLPFRIVGLVTDPPGSNGTDTASNGNYVIVAFNNVVTRSNGAVTSP